MATTPEFDRLLALAKTDPDDVGKKWGVGLREFLGREGMAYDIANHYREAGDLGSLETLYTTGDAKVKDSVLNALWGEPGTNPLMGPGIVALAVRGAGHRAASVRSQACFVFQNQSDWKEDVTSAVGPLLKLLADKDDFVRMMAACAVGNLAKSKSKYDLTHHVALLVRNLGHDERQVRQWSAWALWQLSRHKYDIAAAVPELAGLLARAAECSDAHKNSAGALLHHARKSPENAARVRAGIAAVTLDLTRKAVQRFADQLAALT